MFVADSPWNELRMGSHIGVTLKPPTSNGQVKGAHENKCLEASKNVLLLTNSIIALYVSNIANEF